MRMTDLKEKATAARDNLFLDLIARASVVTP